MKFQSLFKNITIKQANIFTIIILFLFTMIFVFLLVQEMYQDYEIALGQNSGLENINPYMYEKNSEHLKTILIKTLLSISTLAFIIFAIAFGIYKVLHSLIQKDIESFLVYFKQVAQEEKIMDKEKIFFDDFKSMVVDVNKMVETISKQKKSLRELNSSLEERVEEKTSTLRLMNRTLKEEKTFSQDLLKSQKEFLRYTVHETNTPLSVILTSIELYTMQNGKDRQLSKIEAAVKNIFSIYDDLSYLVKKDQVQYPKTVINLEKYIGGRIDFFQEVAEHSHIEFIYMPKEIDAYIYFNETKLQRIIDNTLTNAIKYTQPKQKVDVILEKNGIDAVVSVGSKSKTIKNPQKVFEAYYREDGVSKEYDGFGLGLRLVYTICEEEGVEIDVNSTEEKTVFSYKFKMMGA